MHATIESIVAILGEDFRGLPDRLYRRLGSFPTDQLEFLVLQFVGRGKELFELLADGLGQICHISQSSFRMRTSGNGEEPVVAFGLLFRLLLDLKYANNSASDNQPREGRRVVNYHDIERVAVVAFGRRHDPEALRATDNAPKELCGTPAPDSAEQTAGAHDNAGDAGHSSCSRFALPKRDRVPHG